MKSEYYQVVLNPEDKEQIAFSMDTGLWQFTFLPFRLCNAPATFERLMETILRGLLGKICLIYLYDVIIFGGSSFKEHLERIKQVFGRFQQAGLKLSPNKCTLAKKEVRFLEHIISGNRIQTNPEKLSAVNGQYLQINTRFGASLGSALTTKNTFETLLLRPIHFIS